MSQPGRTSRHFRLLLGLAGALAATSLALAACGSGPSAAASGTTKTTTTKTTTKGSGGSSVSAAFSAYSACMKQHGVTLTFRSGGHQGFGRFSHGSPPSTTRSSASRPPGSGFSGRFPLPKGVSEAKFQAAQKACRSKLPSRRSFGSFGGGGSSEAFDAYRNCLKLNGVTLPSRPASPSGGTKPTTPPTTNAASRAKFQAAQKACANLLPARGNSSTSSTTAKGN